jgi:hypothetical protein
MKPADHLVDYRGQYSPPHWHTALKAVMSLKVPRGLPNELVAGYQLALDTVHLTISEIIGDAHSDTSTG